MTSLQPFHCIALLAFAVALARAALAAEPQGMVDTWQAGRSGGIAVALTTGDKVEFYQAGKFSDADPRPIGPDTLFEIGSVTKVFTAILLADAVERGLVTLEEPVGEPFGQSGITYRQLATHTSGLPRLSALRNADPLDPYADHTLARLIEDFNAAAPKAKPAPPLYSNFGYAILGQAIAAKNKAPWPTVLKERILGPMGLTDTSWTWREADAARLAPGHKGGQSAPSWTFDAYAPAGAMISSAKDLSRFARAALGLLDTPANTAIAASLQRSLKDDKGTRDSGLGWVLERRGQHRLAWHNGQTGGYHAFVGLHPEMKRGVIILANDASPVEPLGYSLLTGEPLRAPAQASARKADDSVQDFVGNYALTSQITAAVTASGKELFVQLTGQGRLRLRPVRGDRFTVEGVEAEIAFERTPGQREIAALVLHQGGLAQRARRLAPGEKIAGRKEIATTPEALEAYVGRYEFAPGLALTFRQEENRLFAQLTGQPELAIFGEGKDRFFYKVVDAQLSFERGANGEVIAVILHQNGRDQRALRLK